MQRKEWVGDYKILNQEGNNGAGKESKKRKSSKLLAYLTCCKQGNQSCCFLYKGDSYSCSLRLLRYRCSKEDEDIRIASLCSTQTWQSSGNLLVSYSWLFGKSQKTTTAQARHFYFFQQLGRLIGRQILGLNKENQMFSLLFSL